MHIYTYTYAYIHIYIYIFLHTNAFYTFHVIQTLQTARTYYGHIFLKRNACAFTGTVNNILYENTKEVEIGKI